MPNVFSVCDDEMNPIGAALFVTLCQLNHSCQPNAAIVFYGRRAYLRSLQPLAPGEEACISYLPTSQRFAERQYDVLWTPLVHLIS